MKGQEEMEQSLLCSTAQEYGRIGLRSAAKGSRTSDELEGGGRRLRLRLDIKKRGAEKARSGLTSLLMKSDEWTERRPAAQNYRRNDDLLR